MSSVRKRCPKTPLVLYINGNGGLLERMKGTGVDVIGLDWTVDMADGRKRLGSEISVQGNVDPAYLFSPLPSLTEEILRFVMGTSLNFLATNLIQNLACNMNFHLCGPLAYSVVGNCLSLNWIRLL